MICVAEFRDWQKNISQRRGPTAVKRSLADTVSVWRHSEYEVRLHFYWLCVGCLVSWQACFAC